MAATDKTYRNQNILDIVFAVSSILMLLSIVWMLVQDYQREYKKEQRDFRDVQSAIAQRLALETLPKEEDLTKAENAVSKAKKDRDGEDSKLLDLKSKLAVLAPKREKADAQYQSTKADLESTSSLYAIAIEENGFHPSEGAEKKIKDYLARVNELETELKKNQIDVDLIVAEQRLLQREQDSIERPVVEAVSNLKKLNDRFDTQVKIAYNKQWGFGDWFRNLPIIDGFAPPLKIQQITNNDIKINYNLAYATRFDRCTSCHLGIENPIYSRTKLQELVNPSTEQTKQLDSARNVLTKLKETLAGLPEEKAVPAPGAIALTKVALSDAQITEFCAHPRLDLYVGSNSKHPVEKFGCSACHGGQGSATSFTLAAHTPNATADKKAWKSEHEWEVQHDWDFPMLPQRFIESSCVKCHHQITDLITSQNRVEAPKLVRGFNLVKEVGCYGCHEISGVKGGVRVGPDLRLEPATPLESLTPFERAKAESDPDNMPGNLRKVGPSLFRVSEKTNAEWTAKWIRSPRDFRPDTKMPHFYGLSNNSTENLPPEQKKFPDTEIWAVSQFLFNISDSYLALMSEDRDNATKEQARIDELSAKKKADKNSFTKKENRELDRLVAKDKLRVKAVKETPLVDLAKGHQADPKKGRQLFAERGCLACHVHEATSTNSGTPGTETFSPAIMGDATFGPNLSQVAVKLGKKAGDKESARVWLTQWLLNPHLHSPRSRMPVTHLKAEEASDLASWLLDQSPKDQGEWDKIDPKQPSFQDMKDLAKVYLVRLMPEDDMNKLLTSGKISEDILGDLGAEEQELADNFGEAGLKHYLGRKAVGRLGCYACHDIPGYEAAKSIGVALNDWGKKYPDRLAYDNIENFVQTHFDIQPSLIEKGKPRTFTDKKPYEKFYADKLSEKEHARDRIGFLNQKLVEPRSYDWLMRRSWDDRYRMPQFQFARARKKPGEDDQEFKARAWKEEADAREAVMTFILGLTAEPLPSKVVNQPQGDRLAEVKGLQILEKYNCGGCHLTRPGTYDFNVTPDTLKVMLKAHGEAQNAVKAGGFQFLDHNHWVGQNVPAGDRLAARAARAGFINVPKEDDESKFDSYVVVRLAEALRFLDSTDNKVKDIPSSAFMYLPLKDVVPNASAVKDQSDLDRFFNDRLPMGGSFANLLIRSKYLTNKDPGLYKFDGDEVTGDSTNGRAAVPPTLLGQGERTQPDWLYQFLLDPQRVRQMTILRMPKFNLSPDEARGLVDYFAAIERLTNPGIGLSYPLNVLPQKGELDNPYWSKMNKDYLDRLTASKDDKGSLAKRLEIYKAGWQKVHEEETANLKKSIEKSKNELQSTEKDLDEKKEAASKENDAAAKKKLQADLETLTKAFEESRTQHKELETKLEKLSVDKQEKTWKESEAYASDAWRLVLNRQLCLQCHQIADYQASNKQAPGPLLSLAHQRLQPDWMLRWIASPTHFGLYTSPPMPPYFSTTKMEYQHILNGQALQQAQAARDVLMNYPRISALPLNRQLQPEVGEEKKK